MRPESHVTWRVGKVGIIFIMCIVGYSHGWLLFCKAKDSDTILLLADRPHLFVLFDVGCYRFPTIDAGLEWFVRNERVQMRKIQ